ncbi:hypothetical protein ACJZ2D_009997 [Fusarium nematophilum]
MELHRNRRFKSATPLFATQHPGAESARSKPPSHTRLPAGFFTAASTPKFPVVGTVFLLSFSSLPPSYTAFVALQARVFHLTHLASVRRAVQLRIHVTLSNSSFSLVMEKLNIVQILSA